MGATATSIPTEDHQQEVKDGRVQDVLVPWVLQAPAPAKNAQSANGDTSAEIPKGEPSQVLHRYYHLFIEGELRDLIISAGKELGYLILEESGGSEPGKSDKWLRIKGVGWEADNWWIEGEVGIGPICK
jgi:tRNA (uracil-5-)-methyltransferase TRM9